MTDVQLECAANRQTHFVQFWQFISNQDQDYEKVHFGYICSAGLLSGVECTIGQDKIDRISAQLIFHHGAVWLRCELCDIIQLWSPVCWHGSAELGAKAGLGYPPLLQSDRIPAYLYQARSPPRLMISPTKPAAGLL